MSTIASGKDPRLFLQSLHSYVLDPLDSALDTVSREKQELEAELDALTEFEDRISTVPPQQVLSRPSMYCEHDTTAISTVREAYQETIYDVDHYDRVYGETLVESIAAEFGQDFAVAFQPDSQTVFSPKLKETLLATVQTSASERRSFLETVHAEECSLESHRNEIAEMLETLDSSVVPEWFEESMQADIQSIIETRQQFLNTRKHRFDAHDFCEYLYDDHQWSYPVLTAVARLRESVSFN